MNTFSRIILCCMALSLVVIGGCGPKPVEPYKPTQGLNKPEGQNFELPANQHQGDITEIGYDSPVEENLTSGSGPGENQEGFTGDQNSDEYKRKYGRSSTQMSPIYFNFDASSIRNDQIPQMEQNAQYLNQKSSVNVVVEGNCDEQGTNEYNLALCERRAMNGKRYMVELGVDEFRIRTLSYGEERPLFFGSDEDTYSNNRRDEVGLE